MSDAYQHGRKAYEDGIPMVSPDDLSTIDRREWEDGWLDAAAADPDSQVSWKDAGFPEWSAD